MSEVKKKLTWDINELAVALKIDVASVREYFTDGRRISFLIERRIAQVIDGKLAPSEGAGYDLIDKQGGKWEVRSISKGGIYFCPSYMVGSGRSFDKSGFLNKLLDIEGYIISDIESFPDIPFWIISSDEIKKLYNDGELGTTTKITRKKALELFAGK